MITVKKADSSDHVRSGAKGLWWPTDVGGKKSCLLSCPGCGEYFSMHKWDISPEGVMHPSVDHSQPIKRTGGLPDIIDCTFHDYVTLEGWQP